MLEPWKAELWRQYGRARIVDNAVALRIIGMRADVHPDDVFAACHSSVEAARASAAANREHYGHPTLAITPVDGGVLTVVDLRPSLRERGCGPTDPALPDRT